MSFKGILTRNIFLRALNIITGVCITILLTRLMGTEGYGVLSLLIVNASIFSLISCLGSESGITYHFASGSIKQQKIFTIIYIVILFQLALLGLTELIHFSLFGNYWLLSGSEMKFILWGMLYLFGLTIIDKYTAFFNGSHLYTLGNRISVFGNFLFLGIFCYLFFFYDQRDTLFYIKVFIIFTFLQALLMIAGFHFFSGRPLFFSKLEKKDWRIFFSYSFLVFVTNIIQFLAYRIDYWLVDHYRGEEALGLYSLAVRLAQFFWILPILFASIIFPRVADEKVNYNENDFLKLVRVTTAFLFVVIVFSALLAAWAIPLFFGESFRGSASAFLYLLPGYFLFSVNILLAAYFAGRNKLKINFIGSSICFVIVLLLDLWLIPIRGIDGAAIASSIGYSVATFYSMIQFVSITGKPLKEIFVIQREDWKRVKDFFKKQ